METTPVDPATVLARTCAPPADALASLLAKSSTGDLVSECALLFSQETNAAYRNDLVGIKIQTRQIREMQERRMELLKKYWDSCRQSSFWDALAKVFAGVFVALCAVASYYCPPAAAAGVAVAGAAFSGGSKIASATYGLQAAQASGGMLLTDSATEGAGEARMDLLRSLQDATEVERRMLTRLLALQEGEHGLVSEAIGGKEGSRPCRTQ